MPLVDDLPNARRRTSSSVSREATVQYEAVELLQRCSESRGCGVAVPVNRSVEFRASYFDCMQEI